MKLSLKPEVYIDAIKHDKIGSMSEVKDKSGLNYATVLKLCKGQFGLTALRIIGRYFSALGMTADEVSELHVKDLFDVEDE